MARTGDGSQTEQSSPDRADRLSVSQVSRETAASVWARVQPMVHRALRRAQGDRTTSEDMLRAIVAGDMTLWAVHDDDDIVAIVVLSMTIGPAGKKLYVKMLAGHEMHRWVDRVEELLVDLRDLLGAKCIEASCRPGLARVLASRGWSKKAVVMELK